jgi:hypothetical protein
METRYRSLAIGVLYQAYQDALAGDTGARGWLTARSGPFHFWCAVAGIRPSAVARKISLDICIH